MKKIKKHILFENRFIFYKRKEGNTWEEETRDERGMGMAESVISEFEQYYRPNNLEVEGDHPDEIIHGVRDRMMQGPLGATNILSGGSILERRVYEELQRKAQNAPRLYRQMLNEEIRNGANPLEVSRELFTYDIENGGSYNDLLTTLQADIMGLGYIGPQTFVDSQNPPRRINLANPNQVNVFDRATGAPGASGNLSVTIRWHQEDLTSIRSKLEQAGMWNDFSRQENAREFIHLKFRQTLIERTLWKEKTKLSKNKFDPQRLKYWLEDDLHQRALDDNQYQEWYKGWRSSTPNVADLTNEERNELARQQREARERQYDNCLEAKLKKILTPGQLENMSESLETRTMLAYLFYKMNNDEDRENVENMIDEMAGVDYDVNINTLDSVSERIDNFIKDMEPKMEARKTKSDESKDLQTEITSLTSKEAKIARSIAADKGNLTKIRKNMMAPTLNQRQIPAIKAQAEILVKQIDLKEKRKTGIEEKIATLKKKKTTIDAELAKMETELMRELRVFGKFIEENAANTNLGGGVNKNITALNKSIGSIKDCNDLENFITDATKIKEVEDVIEETKKRKTYFENLQKNRPGAAEKMDSRGLLYKLVKRDIELKGATADPLVEEESLITTNILIAQARNQEIFGNVNQSIARRIEQGDWVNADEWIASHLFFSPIMTASEAIEHVCDTDSDLNKLDRLNINSTPADMIRIMQENRMVSAVKLRDLQKKLSELLRGVEVNGKRVRIRDDEAYLIEKFINNLVIVESRLNAEERIQDVAEGFYDTSKNREQQVLQMLQQQTADSVDADERIAENLESHDTAFKRFFLKSELKREYQDAMEQYEGLPDEEVEEELRRRGLTARVRSRGIFSLRAARFWKKAGMGFLKYNPLSLVGYGLYKGTKWFGGYAKSIIWTDTAQERAKKVRERYKGAVIEPVTTGLIAWPLALGSYVISRPKTWMRKISDWASRKTN